MGGKNAQIVLDDADLDLALEGALWGAFGTTGQRCTATSRLIVQKKVHDKFVGMLEGSGEVASSWATERKKGTDVGPLINEDALRKVETYVDIGQLRRREARDWWRTAGETVKRQFFPADDLHERQTGQPSGAGRNLRSGSFRNKGEGRGRGLYCKQRRQVWVVVVDLHAGCEYRFPRAETSWTTESPM